MLRKSTSNTIRINTAINLNTGLGEPGELSQWLCHDDSTINIVVLIIIIQKNNRCAAKNYTKTVLFLFYLLITYRRWPMRCAFRQMRSLIKRALNDALEEKPVDLEVRWWNEFNVADINDVWAG